MNQDNTSRSVRLTIYDGDKDNFALYNARMSAYSTMYGFAEAMKEEAGPNLPSSREAVINETTPVGVKQAKAKRQNVCAFANYTMSFTTEDLMNKIESAKTPEWTKGLAHLVKKSLMRENRPKDTISRVEMRIAISKVMMGEKEDPAKIYENLRALQNRYPGKIEEDDLVAVILQQAPGK